MADNRVLAEAYLQSWISGDSKFAMETSGSTGIPKKIQLQRTALEASAQATGIFLSVDKSDRIFCCLPVNKISGFMQLVRSKVWQVPIHIVSPTGNPLEHYTPKETIASFTPMQLDNIISNNNTKNLLNTFRIVLVGGGAISTKLEKQLAHFKPVFYHTYGMTETCSHIAMRKLNLETDFTPIPNVELRKNAANCLEIKGPMTDNIWISTHDIVRMNGNTFQVIGRSDNTINSGGIKIQPEPLELAIAAEFGFPENSVMVAGLPDEKLGQKLVLLVLRSSLNKMSDFLFDFIPEKYHRPKEIIVMDTFVFTENGKLKRQETLRLLPRVEGV